MGDNLVGVVFLMMMMIYCNISKIPSHMGIHTPSRWINNLPFLEGGCCYVKMVLTWLRIVPT